MDRFREGADELNSACVDTLVQWLALLLGLGLLIVLIILSGTAVP